MKKTYKTGDKIKISQFPKTQGDLIAKQIIAIDSDQTGLDYFSQKMTGDRKVLFKIINQANPVFKDYHYHVNHNTKTIEIIIDKRIEE